MRYKEQCKNKSLTTQERKALKDDRAEHLQVVIKERLAWHRRIRLCTSAPSSLDLVPDRLPSMAIYLDGMDQAKTDLPGMSQDEVTKHGAQMKCRFSLFHAFDLEN